MSRNDTLFSLRYAVRVLERHARLWRNVDNLVRLGSLLAGSGAIAALAAQSHALTLAAGVVFALLQGVEFALRPAEGAARSMAQRRPYADLLARQSELDDGAIDAGYQRIVADDEIVVPELLRYLAYNDVLAERGCDASFAYPASAAMRCMALIA